MDLEFDDDCVDIVLPRRAACAVAVAEPPTLVAEPPTLVAEPRTPRSLKRRMRKQALARSGPEAGAEDPNIEHLQRCRKRRCMQCTYATLGVPWARRLPLVQRSFNLDPASIAAEKTHLADATWLSHRLTTDGRFTVVCIACKGAARFDDVNPIKISSLLAHHQCTLHRKNVLTLLAAGLGPAGQPPTLAPPASDFRILWAAAEKSAMGDGVPGVGGRAKCKKMHGCLAEAIRIVDRAFMADAVSLALHRAESGGTLLARCVAAKSDLRMSLGWPNTVAAQLFASLRLRWRCSTRFRRPTCAEARHRQVRTVRLAEISRHALLRTGRSIVHCRKMQEKSWAENAFWEMCGVWGGGVAA